MILTLDEDILNYGMYLELLQDMLCAGHLVLVVYFYVQMYILCRIFFFYKEDFYQNAHNGKLQYNYMCHFIKNLVALLLVVLISALV